MRSLFHYNEASFTPFPLLYWRDGRIYYINWKILMKFLEKKKKTKNNLHNKIWTITEPWIALQISSIPCVGDPSKQSIVDELCLLHNLTVMGSRDCRSLTKKDVKLDWCGKPSCNCILVELNALPEMWGICHGGSTFNFACEKSNEVIGRCTFSNIKTQVLLQFALWSPHGTLWVLTLGDVSSASPCTCCPSVTQWEIWIMAGGAQGWCQLQKQQLLRVGAFSKAQDGSCSIPFPPWACSRCRCVWRIVAVSCWVTPAWELGSWRWNSGREELLHPGRSPWNQGESLLALASPSMPVWNCSSHATIIYFVSSLVCKGAGRLSEAMCWVAAFS